MNAAVGSGPSQTTWKRQPGSEPPSRVLPPSNHLLKRPHIECRRKARLALECRTECTHRLIAGQLGNIHHGQFRRCQSALASVIRQLDRYSIGGTPTSCRKRNANAVRHAHFTAERAERPWPLRARMHEAKRIPNLGIRKACEQAASAGADFCGAVTESLNQYQFQQTIQHKERPGRSQSPLRQTLSVARPAVPPQSPFLSRGQWAASKSK